MSAILGGSSHLLVNSAPLGSTPSYGVVFACWFKRSATTGVEAMLSLSNNSSSTSRVSMSLHHSGDKIACETFVGGSSAAGTTLNGYSANTWSLAVGWWPDTASRSAKLDGGGYGQHVSTFSPSGLSRVGIGLIVVGDGPGALSRFTGNLAEVAMWSGVTDSTERDALVNRLLARIRPTHVLPSKLVVYQPLLSEANGPLSIGPTFTETGMTGMYDANDHPPVSVGDADPLGGPIGPAIYDPLFGGPIK